MADDRLEEWLADEIAKALANVGVAFADYPISVQAALLGKSMLPLGRYVAAKLAPHLICNECDAPLLTDRDRARGWCNDCERRVDLEMGLNPCV